ncbi:MAG: phosphoribosylamine--glycine ligase [Thermoguttaceae bacterium]|nr:phosphoribosylamine--glycine ligase [Thermoguttaceae bacterium]MBR3220234.1 phosphoribosylamine--glycine ligase [Thermoguttaceae bacterium]
MNVLVIGSGGREHALCWKIAQSPKVDKVYVAPGNAGTAIDAVNVPIKETDFEALIQFAKQNNIGLTVVGPEVPLTLGIVDAFEKEGLRIFGPNAQAAQMEGSKSFCKKILQSGKVPTASYAEFTDADAAIHWLRSGDDAPAVVKADGLAAGKGVIVCANRQEAIDAVRRISEERAFGDAGRRFIIEDLLVGQEASVLAITDGKTIMTLQPAQDHKAAYNGDTGPNTGGMGAYCPASLVDDDLLHKIESNILVPTVHALNRAGTPFRGVLYAGLMITSGGPMVLEYNARFGDPECQPLLMRLKTDLVEVMEAAIDQRLDQLEPLAWDDRPAVCLVMASEGYPGSVKKKGFPISGLDEAGKMEGVKVFHAGTAMKDGAVVNNGGRVLGVTALGGTVAEAKKLAYEAAGKIHWEGAWHRDDIADKEINRQ